MDSLIADPEPVYTYKQQAPRAPFPGWRWRPPGWTCGAARKPWLTDARHRPAAGVQPASGKSESVYTYKRWSQAAAARDQPPPGMGRGVYAYKQGTQGVAERPGLRCAGVHQRQKQTKIVCWLAPGELPGLDAYSGIQSLRTGLSASCGGSGSTGNTTATVSSRLSKAVANASRLSSGTAMDISKISPRCL